MTHRASGSVAKNNPRYTGPNKDMRTVLVHGSSFSTVVGVKREASPLSAACDGQMIKTSNSKSLLSGKGRQLQGCSIPGFVWTMMKLLSLLQKINVKFMKHEFSQWMNRYVAQWAN